MDIEHMTNADKKVAVKAELVTGANARKLATKYDIHYSTVITYRNELRNGSKKEEVLEIAETKEVVLAVVADNIKKQTQETLTPKKAAQFNGMVDEIVEGISSFQLLETDLHTTMSSLLRYANNRISDDMDFKEWEKIAYRIGELHKAIYATGGVAVNVQQNNNTCNSFTNGMVN